MKLNEYQDQAATTMLPQCDNIEYLGLGIAGEAGEVAEKLKKRIRGDEIPDHEIALECGDCIWYISQLAAKLGFSLEEIATMNIAKLNARKAQGKIQGNGDNR